MSTTSPFSHPIGCSLGVAWACPVLGLGLVVVRGGGGAGQGEKAAHRVWPAPEDWSGDLPHTHTPPIWFHFSFPLARNNWPGGWTRVAVGGTSGEGSSLGEGGLRPAGGRCCHPFHLFITCLRCLCICSEPGKGLLASPRWNLPARLAGNPLV